MERTKRQHYVSQAYLRRFTDETGKLHVYDKVGRKTFSTGTLNVAQERCFYDLAPDVIESPEEEQMIERELANVDGVFDQQIEWILREMQLRRNKKVIFKRDKFAIAEGIAIQILRTKSFRKTYVELMEKNLKGIAALVVPEVPTDSYDIKFKEEYASLHQAGLFMFNEETRKALTVALSIHTWRLGLNATLKPFWTSDTPVVKKSHFNHPIYGGVSWASPGVEVAFPLTPKVILIMNEAVYFKELRNYDGKVITIDDERTVDYYNSLQVEQSDRQIYASSPELILADEYCSKHPEVCNPDRERVKVTRFGPYVITEMN